MKARIRDACTEEILRYAGENAFDGGVEVWGAIAEECGVTVGHLFISKVLGQMFGHGTRYWGEDKTGALRMWLTARRRLRDHGEMRVLIHIPEDDKSMMQFWENRRFKKVMTIYAGDVSGAQARGAELGGVR